MHLDDDDDESFFEPPPHPDERTWRHPSEIGQLAASNPAPVAPLDLPPRRVRRMRAGHMYMAAGAAALLIAAMVTGLLVDGQKGAGEDSTETAGGIVPATQPRSESQWTQMLRERMAPALPTVVATMGGEMYTGSGIVINQAGHVITSARLIENASHVLVRTDDGHQFEAEVVGVDPLTDVAVIRIDATDRPQATLGVDHRVRMGQYALTLDAANDADLVVGLVSDLATRTESDIQGVLQIDFAADTIAPGAGVFDDSGVIIGMVPSGGSPTANGYAVPIQVVERVANDLILTGRTSHGWLGIQGENAPSSVESNFQPLGGAQVVRIIAGGPAEAADLEVDDIIVGVRGNTIESMSDLVVALRAEEPGTTLAITVLRDGEQRRVTVELGGS